MSERILADRFSELPDRRSADRRISPAVGEFAIGECARLREINKELLAALQSFVGAEEAWEKEKRGMPSGTFDDPLGKAYKHARAAIAKATS